MTSGLTASAGPLPMLPAVAMSQATPLTSSIAALLMAM
jgi:hypothetical protein